MIYLVIGILVVVLVLIVSNIRIVPQSYAYVIERLGAFSASWQVGLHVKIPFIERIANKMSLKEKVLDFEPQPVITKDNVTMMIDTVIYFQITDPKLYTYGVERPINAIENLSATTLRNIIGELELDQTLTSRDVINTKMRSILDEATDPWGIKVNRVDVKNTMPPEAIKDAMEKQMRAERDKRAQILTAEGQKEAVIRESEGKMQQSINHAEGARQAEILAAEAEKQAKILRAEGEAEAIRRITAAVESSGADPAQYLIAMRYLEVLGTMGTSKSDKVVYLPFEATGILSAIGGIKDIAGGVKGPLAPLVKEVKNVPPATPKPTTMPVSDPLDF